MSNSSTELLLSQGVVGLPAEEKFPWTKKKLKGYRLAQLYDAAGMPELGNRAAACASALGFRVGDEKRTLAAANFCQLRLCPLCTARKAKKMAWTLSRVMDGVEAKYDARFIFLTLTVKNCGPDDLACTLDSMTKGWSRLYHLNGFNRAVGGWFRALEITRNGEKNTYHPHIHAILAVPKIYFAPSAGLYLDHDLLVKMWRESMNLPYDPSVWICKTGEKCEGAMGTDIPGKKASKEAAKYTTKDSEYINFKLSLEEAADVVKTYTWALYRRRMTAYGGWMRKVAKELGVENVEMDKDLVHIDQNAVREDLACAMEVYRWNLGVKDYVLTDVIPAYRETEYPAEDFGVEAGGAFCHVDQERSFQG